MGIYELLWRLFIPLLKHHPRLRQGFAARSAADHLPAADIWLHAASAGEAYLALTLVNNLPTEARLRVLITTNTRQGLDIIKTGATAEKIPPGIAIHSIYIPFDRPRLAQQAVQRVFPKVMILLETELWPGLLLALKKHNIPVLLLNGRITAKSLKSYLLWPGLWKCLGPDHVLAISQEDAGRFGRLFGHKNVHTMKNIKFDQLNTQAHPATDHLKTILPQDRPFLVLGSVRQEEEKSVEAIITRIHSALPEILIGLFPRHMERMDYWTQTLNQLDINWIRRSDLNQGTAPDATVILWDVFGELQPAYALARAVFVGGSLAPL